MIVLLFSEEDIASMNIYSNLLSLGNFDFFGKFEGENVIFNEKYILVKIQKDKTNANYLDLKLKKSLNIYFDTMIVASKHESLQKIKSLTAHPIGNFNLAELGGMPKTLVNTSPSLLSESIRLLRKNRVNEYQVSLEATHHGPFLECNTFFIEIGSTEKEWADKDAGYAIANTILNLKDNALPTFISFGGGHYEPQVTDLVLKNKLNVGHMASKYNIEFLDAAMVGNMIERSHNPTYAYFVKGLTIEQKKRLEGLIENRNIKVIEDQNLGN